MTQVQSKIVRELGAWQWLVDDAIPSFVKETYSPKVKWQNRPFTEVDARFFSRGIQELSGLFTEERPRKMPPYLDHPKFRSSYLLYFLPLQAAKFLTIFNQNPDAILATLKHAESTGVLRIADLGAGPGTASLSLLLWLIDSKRPLSPKISKIELNWFDFNRAIMEDGKKLVDRLVAQFPAMYQNKIEVKTHSLPWWKAPTRLSDPLSLVLIGNVLNEDSSFQIINQPSSAVFWKTLFSLSAGGGILFVEPAAKQSSQLLSHLRNYFFESNLIEKNPNRIWGPCLHAGNCPLTTGRDWCHFSVPTQIPGKWFKFFSKALGSERQWLKFSYLWFTSSPKDSPLSSTVNSKLRRVISDPLNPNTRNNSSMVLICEPDRPGRKTISGKVVHRGDLIQI